MLFDMPSSFLSTADISPNHTNSNFVPPQSVRKVWTGFPSSCSNGSFRGIAASIGTILSAIIASMVPWPTLPANPRFPHLQTDLKLPSSHQPPHNLTFPATFGITTNSPSPVAITVPSPSSTVPLPNIFLPSVL